MPVQSDRVSVGRLCKVLSLRLEAAPAGGAVETVGTREEADLLDNQLGSSRNRTPHEIGPQGFLRVFSALLSILAISVLSLSQLMLPCSYYHHFLQNEFHRLSCYLSK